MDAMTNAWMGCASLRLSKFAIRFWGGGRYEWGVILSTSPEADTSDSQIEFSGSFCIRRTNRWDVKYKASKAGRD